MSDTSTHESTRAGREAARARRLAVEHGVDPDAFGRLIAESRAEARHRRRRVPDARLREFVQELRSGR